MIVRKPLEPVFAEKKHKVHSWGEKAILPSNTAEMNVQGWLKLPRWSHD